MTDRPLHPPGLAQQLWPEPCHLAPLRVSPPGAGPQSVLAAISIVDAGGGVLAVFYGPAALRMAEETCAALSAGRGLREAASGLLARIPAWENGPQLLEHEQALVDLRARLDRAQGLILLEGAGSPLPGDRSP